MLLDLRKVSSFADYFVICTCSNVRHLQSLAEELDMGMGRLGVTLLHREGNADSGWILLDFGDVIVHLFAAVERERYGLERLWHVAPAVLRVQ